VAANPGTIIFPPKYQATFEAPFKRNYDEVAFGRMTVTQAVDKFFSEANAGLGQ
jgi:multiple sugar transport system substrate-binding protein